MFFLFDTQIKGILIKIPFADSLDYQPGIPIPEFPESIIPRIPIVSE